MTDQRGVALITVLLVVALATIAAVGMTRQTGLDHSRTGNRLALIQAQEIAIGGERWAAAVLARDRRDLDTAAVDSLDQDWAVVLPPMEVDGGWVAGRIEDMQGRFNINTLVRGDTVDAVALERFERLLLALDLDPRTSQAVVDWLDRNRETTFPAGAEDDYYMVQREPYLAANRPIAVASELRLIRGFDEDVWQRIAPHVSALPRATAINVNTATVPVLQAIVPGLDAATAEALTGFAAEEPFDSIAAFRDHPLVPATDAAGGPLRSAGLDVRSAHFRVRIDVELGPITYTLYSWLQRHDDGASRVFRRSRTPN